jgi:predicted dienelactone hydrolase
VLPVSPGEGDDVWFDASRRREVPLRVRWPAGTAPCALILYSHGLGGSRTGGDVWGRAWQAAGMAVVHVQHPGSDTEVLREGTRALFAAATGEQLVARVADMRFVVDEVLRRGRETGVWSRVRTDAIGAAGHSFGAQTTQALAGQRYAASFATLADLRLRAFIALSPMVGRNDASSESQQFGAITRPFLCLTGSLDGDPLGSNRTAADRARVYDGLPPGQRALLWLEGADHMTFGGNGQMRLTARRGPLARADGAIEAEPRHHALIAQATAHWWRWRLLGDAAAQAALNPPQGLGPKDRWAMD